MWNERPNLSPNAPSYIAVSLNRISLEHPWVELRPYLKGTRTEIVPKPSSG